MGGAVFNPHGPTQDLKFVIVHAKILLELNNNFSYIFLKMYCTKIMLTVQKSIQGYLWRERVKPLKKEDNQNIAASPKLEPTSPC